MPDVCMRRTTRLVVIGDAELGGYKDVASTRSKGATEEHLRIGIAINVGCVKEGDAVINGGMDDTIGGRLVEAATEVVAPKANDRRVE